MPRNASDRSRASALLEELGTRCTLGLGRVRAGFFQSLQIVVAAMGAYLVATHLLGHPQPLFAATAAVVSLGYVAKGDHLRRVFEVTLGCVLGISIGEGLLALLGRGPGQGALVLLVSILLARFLDNGTIFSIQMGLQSAIVVLLPPAVGGPLGRVEDAVVGGLCALVVMMLVPRDPRREPRQDLTALCAEFAHVLREAANAIGDYDRSEALHALARARRTQPYLTRLEGSLSTNENLARLALTRREASLHLEEYRRALNSLDYAIRSARVLVRRIHNVIDTVRLRPEAVRSLHQVLMELSEAVDLLGLSVSADTESARTGFRSRARKELVRAAQSLDPQAMGVRTYQGETLVMMLRPMTVDLLVAAGMDPQRAQDSLVVIEQDVTEAIEVVDPADSDPRG